MASLCKNCAGTLVFDPTKHELVCKICGQTFAAEDISDYSEELLSDDINTLRKRSHITESSYYDANIYTCNHCGAEVLIHGSESSTFCIYCGNPAIVFSRVSKQVKPDGIIPFKITKEQALANVKEQVSGAAFVPSELKDFKIDKIRGIYIPYWLVDVSFHDAIVVDTLRFNNDNEVVGTDHYGIAGSCEFRGVMCDASTRFANDMSFKLEPYFLKDMVDFDPDYLAGFYSDVSDISLKELRNLATKRCDLMFREMVSNRVPGKGYTVRDCSPAADLHNDPVYAMFPVWCLTYTFEDLPHTILVNGQTGKVVGAVPFDRKKAIKYITFWTLLISLIILGISTALLVMIPWGIMLIMYPLLGFMGFVITYFSRNKNSMKAKIRNLLDNIKTSRSHRTAELIRRRAET